MEQLNGTKIEEAKKTNYAISLNLSFNFDYKYWTTGCISINGHSKALEIEFLCFGIYIGKL